MKPTHYKKIDYEEQLEDYLKIIEESLANNNFDEALKFLWNGLAIVEHIQHEKTVLKLLTHTTNLSFYLSKDRGFQYLIEQLLSKVWIRKEVNASLYFILSIIHLQRSEYMQSFYAAKLSHYHAEQLNLASSNIYLCNAQLQLALTMIYTKQIPTLKKLLIYFNWYVENCRDEREQILINTILLMVECAESRDNEKHQQLFELGNILSTGQAPFYPLYLLLHLKHFSLILENETLINSFTKKYAEKRFSSTVQNPEAIIAANKNAAAIHTDQFFEKLPYEFQSTMLQQQKYMFLYVKAEANQLLMLQTALMDLAIELRMKIFYYNEFEQLICIGNYRAEEVLSCLEKTIPKGSYFYKESEFPETFIQAYSEYLTGVAKYFNK